MISKKKIKLLIYTLFSKKLDKKKIRIFFYNSDKAIRNQCYLVIHEKNFFLKLIFVFAKCILQRTGVQKNFFIIYNLKNVLIGNNLIPDWPGDYLKQNLFINLKMWFKIFSYIFLYKKKLYLIILKLN